MSTKDLPVISVEVSAAPDIPTQGMLPQAARQVSEAFISAARLHGLLPSQSVDSTWTS